MSDQELDKRLGLAIEKADLIFVGIGYSTNPKAPGRKTRRRAWNPNGVKAHSAILRDEDWSALGVTGIPVRLLSLTDQKSQEDGIVDIHNITIEVFRNLHYHVTGSGDFRRAGEVLNQGPEIDEDEYIAEQEALRLATDQLAEVNRMIGSLATFNPTFAYEIPPN